MKIGNLVIAVTYFCVMFASFPLRAEGGLEFVGEVATTNKNIEFLTIDGDTGEPISLAPKIITLDYAATVLYKDFYARAKLSQTIQDDTVFFGDFIVMSRWDADFTLGYYVGKGVSIFAGQKRGVLEADVFVDQVVSPTEPNIRIRFTDSGPFVGMSYRLPLDKSALSFSFAYADMDGKINGFIGLFNVVSTGDTTGFSYSASWTKPVSKLTNFFARLNVIRYEFDDQQQGLSADFNAEQEFDNLSLGIVHYF